MHRIPLLIVALSLLAQDAKPPAKKPGLPLVPERKIEFTTDEATWLSLSLTPDGKTIVFELLGDLYTLPIGGGQATQLTSGMAFDSQPSVSPDGKRLAFISDRDGSENLWVANLDGSQPKQLSKDPQGDFQSPSWTPDGDYILVSRRPPASGLHELWMFNINGGSGVQVTKSSPNPKTPPPQAPRAAGAGPSPAAQHIPYSRRARHLPSKAACPRL